MWIKEYKSNTSMVNKPASEVLFENTLWSRKDSVLLLKLVKPKSLNICFIKWVESILPNGVKDLKDYVQDDDLRKKMDTFTSLEKQSGRIEKRTAFATCTTNA